MTRRDQAIVENYLSKIAPGSPVLDIPAGTGRFIQFCLDRGLRYTGVDISADMLEVARTKVPAGANVELTVADARALPFEDDAFDYAIIIKFIKWLPTVETLTDVLGEIKESRGRRPSSKSRSHANCPSRAERPVYSANCRLLVTSSQQSRTRTAAQPPPKPLPALSDRFLGKNLTKHFPRRGCTSVPSCPMAISDADATSTSCPNRPIERPTRKNLRECRTGNSWLIPLLSSDS